MFFILKLYTASCRNLTLFNRSKKTKSQRGLPCFPITRNRGGGGKIVHVIDLRTFTGTFVFTTHKSSWKGGNIGLGRTHYRHCLSEEEHKRQPD